MSLPSSRRKNPPAILLRPVPIAHNLHLRPPVLPINPDDIRRQVDLEVEIGDVATAVFATVVLGASDRVGSFDCEEWARRDIGLAGDEGMEGGGVAAQGRGEGYLVAGARVGVDAEVWQGGGDGGFGVGEIGAGGGVSGIGRGGLNDGLFVGGGREFVVL